jgi:hypothetical protein
MLESKSSSTFSSSFQSNIGAASLVQNRDKTCRRFQLNCNHIPRGKSSYQTAERSKKIVEDWKEVEENPSGEETPQQVLKHLWSQKRQDEEQQALFNVQKHNMVHLPRPVAQARSAPQDLSL